MQKIYFIVFVLFSQLVGFSQDPHLIVKDIFIQQRTDHVYLQWTIKEGRTCNDIHIERSSDGLYFERIGLISGVCGSSDSDVVFFFTDEEPVKNKINYYRLELGSQGYTTTFQINTRIIDNYFILQNPVKESLNILFAEGSLRSIEIYDTGGKRLYTQQITDQDITITVDHLQAGVYIIVFREENKPPTSSKFVVAK